MFEEGQKVTYIGNPHKGPEHGVVKRDVKEGLVPVVFNCGGDWANYKNYTAARCNPVDLKLGWLKPKKDDKARNQAA